SFRPVAGPDGKVSLEDRWMFSRLSQIAGEMASAWDAFRFHEAAHLIYHFFWHEFCDWYLELKKLSFDAEEGKQAAFENLCRAFDIALRLLHPMMPFISEELWQRLAGRQSSIALAAFPARDADLLDGQAELQMNVLQSMIVGIRNARSQWGVDAGRKIPIKLAASHDLLDLSNRHQPVIERLANVTLVLEPATAEDIFFGQSGYRIEPPEGVDHAAEKSRLHKQEQKLSREIVSLKAQLENQQFLSKASPQIVAERRRRMEEVAAEHAKVQTALQELG
ncbi:MAG: class I tRNA ligase family protein, partial [Terriglobia bacterium]